MSEQWYTVFSFVTTPTSDPTLPTFTDLSAYFNAPAVAQAFRKNMSWRLVDSWYSASAVNPMVGWSGNVSGDGQLLPGSGTPSNLVFAETTNSARHMEIQVAYDPEPTAMSVSGDDGAQITGSKSRIASAVSPYGVELATGRFLFDLPLMSVAAVGAGQWNFGLRYYPDFGINGITGAGFNTPQSDVLTQLATIGSGVGGTGANDIELASSGNTREVFKYDYDTGTYLSTDNNTAAVLKRTGMGTSADQFTLIASDGTVTQFFGLFSGIDTPGQMKSVTDRFGNTQSFSWTSGSVQLRSAIDSYGRTTQYAYGNCDDPQQVTQISDFLGRQLNFQYDDSGHLTAVVTPSVFKAAPGNTFPGGRAYVFQYDTGNPRPERRNDLTRIYYPNQTQSYLNTDTRTVDVAAVYAQATARYQIVYGQDPADVDTYGKVVSQTVGDPANGVGGVAYYSYTTTGLPTNIIDGADPITGRTTFTDCNGNQTYFDFNARHALSHRQVLSNRNTTSLQAASFETWTSFNTHSQPLTTVMPEGDSRVQAYEDETNTVTIDGAPYARRIGLLKTITRLPGNSIGVPSRGGSGPSGGVQNELTIRQFMDPLFNQVCCTIDERGNPIDPTTGAYFPPQNEGTTPTDADRSRYATIYYFDYQKDAAATVAGDAALQVRLGLDVSTDITELITFVNGQMTATDGTGGIPAGFQMALGAINGDGTPSFTALTLTGSPTGGTFQLLYGATATGNITFTLATPATTAAAIQSALLTTVGSGTVTVNATSAYDFRITVVPASGFATAVSFNPSNNFLTGGTSPAAITSTDLRRQGAVVKIAHPSVRQLIPNAGEGDPWMWQTQPRIELYTTNARGQQTTHTDSEGNVTAFGRYPENNPTGDCDFISTLSGQQYGFLSKTVSDIDPNDVMDLVGLSGDMTDFVSGIVERTNTPGVYQNLATNYGYESMNGCGGSCSVCQKPTTVTDPRGYTTTTNHNEVGQTYETVSADPYNFTKQYYYDSNGNMTREDTEDQVPSVNSSDPTSAGFGQFAPAADGSTANMPMEAGAGGSLRPGWYSNLYQYNLLDWRVSEDVDATGSCPPQLETRFEHDSNGNIVKITKSMLNTVEYAYNERNLQIAMRVGFDPSSTAAANGALITYVYDGNSNLVGESGPAMRSSTVQTIAPSAAPTTGSFQLIFNGDITAAIAGVSGGTTAATIQTALYNLPNINNGAGATNVTVTGSAGGPYTVSFVGTLGASVQPLLVLANNTTNATAINLFYVSSSSVDSTASSSLTTVLNFAFSSSAPITHTGDFTFENTLDGFDRTTGSIDAVGTVTTNAFAPDGATIQTAVSGPAGGVTPADRSGANNVALSSMTMRFDEASRTYEVQSDVFLHTGISGGSPTHALPSTRSATHTGGGLATDSTTNSNTGAVTLTTGGTSYALIRYVFDRLGRQIAAASDNTAIGTTEYNGMGWPIRQTDALLNTTDIVHDENGNTVEMIRTQVCTVTDSTVANELLRWAGSYDSHNRLMVSASSGADGTFQPCLIFSGTTALDNLGVSSRLPWSGLTTTQFTFTAYNSRGIATAKMDPKGNVTLITPDGAGRTIETTQVLTQPAAVTTDTGTTGMSMMGLRRSALVSAALSAAPSLGSPSGTQTLITTRTVFDGNGRLVALIDDRGATTTYAYDQLDREIIMRFQDGSTRTSAYNLAGDLISYTDENQSVLTNTYDALGRKTAVAINLATNVHGARSQAFQYDGLSRLTFCTEKDSFPTHIDVGFSYDSLGRVIEEGQTYLSDTRYITHDAWTSLVPTDLKYPNNRQVTSGYDALYRRNSVNETSGGASIAAWQFSGDRTVECVLGNGLICTQLNNSRTNSMVQSPDVPNPAWGDVSSDRLGYDGAGRMITKRFVAGGINGDTGAYNTPTSLVGFTAAYDQSSNKLYERALHAESRSALYPSYDSLNRLLEYDRGVLASGGESIATPISLPGTDSQRTYNLDHLGNWKTTTYTPVGSTQTTEVRRHNLMNELLKFGSTKVTYDRGNNTGSSDPLILARGNGNIASDGTLSYFYDVFNRLINVYKPGESDPVLIATYVYDALGRRVLKGVQNGGASGTITNAVYRYLYDGQQIVEELLFSDSNTTLRQFVWGQYIDELIQLKTYADTGTQPLAAGNYYPLQDLLYRTTALTNSSGGIVEAYDYDAYGNTLMYSGKGTDGEWFTDDDVTTLQPACEFLFTGREYDPETHLYWYRARFYRCDFGRFVSRDPILPLDGVNYYEYTGGQPVTRLDAAGLRWVGEGRGKHFVADKPPQKDVRDPCEPDCYIRTRVNRIGHYGLDIDLFGNPNGIQQLDADGPGPIALIDTLTLGPGFPMKPGGTPWLKPLIPLRRDDDYPSSGKDAITRGKWFPVSAKKCRCLLGEFERTVFIHAAQRVRYHLTTTNSGWALKCFMQYCGLTLDWHVFVPVGANDATDCPI